MSVGQGSARQLPALFARLGEQAIEDRRDLHAHPEVGWTEFRTSARLVERLQALGLSVRWGREIYGDVPRMGLPPADELEAAFARAEASEVDRELLAPMRGGYTGCVADLPGSRPGPTIVLRFDIDALPIQEDTSDDHRPARDGFVSRHPGRMHACGHDGHAAIGLGAAEALSSLHTELGGKVRFVFQPSEEGARGAAAMVAARLVDGADYFLGVHVGAQSRRTGEVIPGLTGLLATEKWDLHFRGRESHAGLEPEEGRNALLAAALATVALHGIPRHSGGNTRVNVGVLNAGVARNVIPASARCAVEFRADHADVLASLLDQARAVVHGIADAQRVEVDLDVVGSAPNAVSDPDVISVVERVATSLPGVERVAAPSFAEASDDATWMMQRVQERGGKAAYVVVGSELPAGHHTPRFDFDERVLSSGIALLAQATLALAGNESHRGASAH